MKINNQKTPALILLAFIGVPVYYIWKEKKYTGDSNG